MKKVLVTGASGTVGIQVLKFLLLESKYEITALDLKSSESIRKLKKYKSRINIIYGDINDQTLIYSLIKDHDVVIHLAAVLPPLADVKPELTKLVNFYGTENIVNAINDVNPQCFLIFSSSISVYGDRLHNYWIKMTDKVMANEQDSYASIKIETENLIKNNLKNYTIFRLSAVMGRPKEVPMMFNMPLDTKLEITTDQDTAYAFVKAIEHQSELNKKIFNLGGGESCRTTYREFIIKMFQIYGLNYELLHKSLFADKNFHCGYYKDSDDLDNILNYRSDTLNMYYNRVNRETMRSKRMAAKFFSRPIIYFLEKPIKKEKKSNEK